MAIFQQEIEIVLHVDFLTDESVNSTTLIKYMVSFKLYAICTTQFVSCEPSTPSRTRKIIYATCLLLTM